MAFPILPILVVLGAGAFLLAKRKAPVTTAPPSGSTATADDFEILTRGEAVVAIGVPDKKYSLPDGTTVPAGDPTIDALLAANVDKGSMVSLALRNKSTREIVPAVVIVNSVLPTSFGPSYGGPASDPSKATGVDAKSLAAALRGPKPGTLLVFGTPQMLDAAPPPGVAWKPLPLPEPTGPTFST